ncbi:MAG TPA: PLP-dependent aminotransferase family protein [Candidimonas sp.]|nr:PLP-dependent aminotransferase family protein [Candidimonas sp.]
MTSIALAEWLQLWLDTDSDQPAYHQLYLLFRKAILTGKLPPDSRLPASRLLAKDLGIARNTIIQVYEQLALEGYVHATTGKGTFVADVSQDSIEDGPAGETAASPNVAPYPSLSQRGVRLVHRLGFSNRQQGAFMSGVPDISEFPFKTWQRIQNKRWRNQPEDLLGYAPAGGYEPLRHAISAYVNSARSVNSSARQVIITTGIHQGVDVITRLLTEPGDLVWIEEPSYWGLRNLLLSSGLRVKGIAVDAEGLNPDPQQMKHPPKLIVITPSHQYPLGMVMSLSRRRMLLEYAHQHGCWIVEDDYDSEFRFGSRPLQSLQGLDEWGRVLYAGSFSKMMYPGLRTGYLVVPVPLADHFANAVAELYREGRLMTQANLAEFLAEGYLSSHVRRVRNLYASRRQCLIHAIQRRYGNSLEIIGDDAGLHLVLGLPDGVDDMAIAHMALQRGIIVRPLSDYYLDGRQAKKGLLLGFGCVSEEQINAAFPTLGEVIDAALAKIS